MRSSTFGLLGLLLAGCVAAGNDAAPPEHILGKYTYQDNGRLAKHPWTLDAALVLERDAQYTLELNFNIDNDDEHETTYGTYRVDGNKLILDPADGSEHEAINEFIIEGDRLRPKLGWGSRLALKGLKVNPVFVKAD